VGILDEDVAKVREATDFVAVAGEHLALKKQGIRWLGLCPFHAEKSPSFSINAELGLYYCFGCQASGDVITFVREIEHLDFVDAVQRLAARAGIQLHYDDVQGGRDQQRRAALYEAMTRAVAWYHQRLLEAPDAAPARRYLRSRGYGSDEVRTFQLGWAPGEWDTLARALKLPDDVLRDTGLGSVPRPGRQIDAFRGRVMFPIFEASGQPVAFGGRMLPGGDPPKYRNSSETPIYHKSRVLYALNWSKKAVVENGEVVVCEGYTDVIGFYQAGVPRAVATCGTALAEGHFALLKNFGRRVVLAYDADAAGQSAAERFYQWEQKFDLDIAVASLPAGADPGDLAREDPALLRKAVEEARPFLEFRVDRLLGSADLRTVEGRARAAGAAMTLINEHPNALVRDQYLMRVADRCRVDPERLRAGDWRAPATGAGAGTLAGSGTGAGSSASGAAAADAAAGGPAVRRRPGVAAVNRAELEALRLAVHRPEELAGHLPLDDPDRLAEVLFVDPLHRGAFLALLGATTLHEALATADPDVADLLRRLALEETDAEGEDVLCLLVRNAGVRTLHHLESEARVSGTVIDLSWLKLDMEQLAGSPSRLGALSRLVPWLVAQAEEDG
jgi:DNA primase